MFSLSEQKGNKETSQQGLKGGHRYELMRIMEAQMGQFEPDTAHQDSILVSYLKKIKNESLRLNICYSMILVFGNFFPPRLTR